MVFNAIIYHIDNHVIIRFLDLNYTDLSIHASMDYYRTADFFIERRATFELTPHGLYLPGRQDFETPMPRSKSINFHTKLQADEWIKQFQIATKSLNGVNVEIIDLDFPMEEVV